MLRKDPFITGEYYHLYNRGVDKRNIFKKKRDFERFLMLLYISNFDTDRPFRLDNLLNHQDKKFEEVLVLEKGEPLVSVGAWCLMTNHFHLLVRQEVDGGITKFMRKVGTGYSMFFNKKYNRKGSLFGGLFKSKLIGVDDNYLVHLFAYIHLNSLDINFPKWKKGINFYNKKEMKEFLESYRYSSYLDYTGVDRVEKNILKKDRFPKYFQGVQSFKEFTENYFKE